MLKLLSGVALGAGLAYLLYQPDYVKRHKKRLDKEASHLETIRERTVSFLRTHGWTHEKSTQKMAELTAPANPV